MNLFSGAHSLNEYFHDYGSSSNESEHPEERNMFWMGKRVGEVTLTKLIKFNTAKPQQNIIYCELCA